jgi:hypothetical protein
VDAKTIRRHLRKQVQRRDPVAADRAAEMLKWPDHALVAWDRKQRQKTKEGLTPEEQASGKEGHHAQCWLVAEVLYEQDKLGVSDAARERIGDRNIRKCVQLVAQVLGEMPPPGTHPGQMVFAVVATKEYGHLAVAIADDRSVAGVCMPHEMPDPARGPVDVQWRP